MRPFLFLATSVALAAAEPQRFTSGPTHVTLVELYTSEGCSSCPPAERWVAARKNDAGLWRDFVPVAFHVDYWNQLGWPDRFSARDFTQRQYAIAEAWGTGSVYTPCFVRDGAEWRPAGDRELLASTIPAGMLTVSLDGDKVIAEFVPTNVEEAKGGFEITFALLGSGLVSKVTAGENSGETLRQEFVALALARHALATTSDGYHGEFSLPNVIVKSNETPRAIAAWVSRRGELAPLQATGGWLAP
jgi:hypothetical protein